MWPVPTLHLQRSHRTTIMTKNKQSRQMQKVLSMSPNRSLKMRLRAAKENLFARCQSARRRSRPSTASNGTCQWCIRVTDHTSAPFAAACLLGNNTWRNTSTPTTNIVLMCATWTAARRDSGSVPDSLSTAENAD